MVRSVYTLNINYAMEMIIVKSIKGLNFTEKKNSKFDSKKKQYN